MTTRKAFVCGMAFAVALGATLPVWQRLGESSARAAEKNGSRQPPTVVLNSSPVAREGRGVTTFAPVVKKVSPSVVTIYTTKTVRRTSMMSPFNDPTFRHFFGGPEEEEDPQAAPRSRNGRRTPQPRAQKEQSLGSGVIVSADGYILSNNHVVDGADEVKVSLSGSDEEYVAKVIGTDPSTDVSVLKINAKNLPPITITDSDNLQVGDVVLAVGNPFGVGQTVTMGIVSATGRSMGGIVSYEDFIQTDAAINMGNSGGALVDAEGRLIGINTAILSPTGGSIGLGFAVPINMARRVMDSLIKDGKVTRGYLGIQLHPEISASEAKVFKLKDRSGAMVDDVVAGSPADKAGVQQGDVILELDGKKVPDSRQFRLWVSQTAPDSKITLKVMRDGTEKRLTATLGMLDPKMTARSSAPGRTAAPKKSDALDGVEVTDIDAAARRQWNIPRGTQGALVTSVDPDSKAAEARLKAGDVILEINRQKVRDAQEAIEVSETLKDDEPILLKLSVASRDGERTQRIVVVEPEKPSRTDKPEEK